MAKYYFTYSCGHNEKVELFGKGSDRERKLEYFRNYGICPDCYREKQEIQMLINHDKKEMSYREYKELYPDCKTVPGSYNGTTKTIIVYVPKGELER